MKVKNDHCCEFSNLSNWKEDAWKKQGFNGIIQFADNLALAIVVKYFERYFRSFVWFKVSLDFCPHRLFPVFILCYYLYLDFCLRVIRELP